jgi:MFS transporter, DHA1 family, multidrug resistance protein
MRIDRFSLFGIWGGGMFFAINGLVGPFFTLYASELGASTLAIGFMVTLKALLPIVIAMPAGQLIDSVGPMRMLKFGSLFQLAALVAVVLADGLWLLALSQVLMGAAIIIMASSFQVLVARGDKDVRNDAIKRYSMWMSGGSMLGPILGGTIASAFVVPTDGYHAAFAAALAVAILFQFVLIAIARGFPHPDPAEAEVKIAEIFSPQGYVASYKRGIDLTAHRPVQFGLIATFLIMYIQSIYMSFLPLYLVQHGYGTMTIGAIVSTQGLMGMLSRYSLGRFMTRYPLESIIQGAGIIAAVSVLLTPLAVLSPVSMFVLAGVVGAAMGVNLPVSLMIMVEAVGDSQRGKLMGLRLLVNRFSQVISPVMFGVLGQTLGLTSAFLGGGVLLVATVAGFSLYAQRSWRVVTWGNSQKPAE